MRKQKLTKALGLIMAVFMLVSLVTACGNSSENPPAASGSTEPAKNTGEVKTTTPASQHFTMWGWNPGDIEKIFTEFSKTNPGITFDYATVQQAEAFQKLQTTVSAGLDLPDLVPSEIGQRGTMLKLDIWENLGAAPYNFNKSMIFDYLIPLISNEKGEIVCIPWDISSAALCYRRPLAKEYFGTDDHQQLQSMFTSWDAVLDKGKKVFEDSKGKIYAFASLNDIRIIADGQNPTPVVKDGKLNLENSVKVTLDIMVKFRDNNVVDNISGTSPAYNASYSENKHIFFPCASWSPTYVIEKNDPQSDGKWGLMLPPGGCFSWGGTGHMIPKDAKNKEVAFKFANWLVTKEGAIAQRKILGYNMANKEAYQDPEIVKFTTKSFGDQNLGEIFFVEAMKNLTPRPVSLYDVVIADVWNLVTEALNSDRNLTADAALKMFETEFRNKAPEVQ